MTIPNRSETTAEALRVLRRWENITLDQIEGAGAYERPRLIGELFADMRALGETALRESPQETNNGQ